MVRKHHRNGCPRSDTNSGNQPGAIDHQSGTIDHQSGTIDHQSGTIDHQSGTIDHRSGALEREEGKVGAPGLGEQEKIAILDHLWEAVTCQDARMRLAWANKTAGDIAGLPAEQLVGRLCYEVWHQRHGPCPGCPVEQARQMGQPAEGEVSTPNGRTWLVRAYPLHGPSGEISSIIEIGQDITARKEDAEALRDSEERYRALFEQSKDAVYIVTRHGELLDFNQAALDLFGGTREEAIGINVRDLYADPSQRDKFQREVEAKGAVRDFEVRLRRKDGTEMDCLLTATAWRDPDGNVRGYLGILRDITALKQAVSALRESEERYRTLVESADDAIWVKDTAGRFVAVNSEYARRLGLSKADIIGKTVADFYPEELARQFMDEDKQVLATGEPLQSERQVSTPLGLRSFDARKVPLRSQAGEVIGLVAISRDVTERKEAERTLRVLSQRLVEVQEQEQQHIARELHDQIGQGLSTLKLLLTMAGRSPGENAATRLREAQMQLDELIARVRDLSLDLRPSVLDDLGLLPALLWHFKRYTARTGVRVNFTHSGLQRPIRNEVELAAYRIVQEGLTNVARHASVDQVSVQVWAKRDWLGIQIEDQGAGFDPVAALAGGATAGLTGMRERAALLGGELTLEAMPGAGTRLTAQLPLRVRSKRAPRREPEW